MPKVACVLKVCALHCMCLHMMKVVCTGTFNASCVLKVVHAAFCVASKLCVLKFNVLENVRTDVR